MKREILEAVFPEAKGEYIEFEYGEQEGWSAVFKERENTWQINLLHGDFWAEKIIIGRWTKCVPIPIKAILLLAQYENQQK